LNYFSGPKKIFSVDTKIGVVSAYYVFPDSGDGSLSTHIEISIEFPEAIELKSSIDSLMDLRSFFTVFCGRPQRIYDLRVLVTESNILSNRIALLDVHWSYAPNGPKHANSRLPARYSMPMHVTHAPEEFASILQSWLVRQKAWGDCRYYFVQCLEAEIFYDTSRLIMVVNLFDIIPINDIPDLFELPDNFLSKLDVIQSIVDSLPAGFDRELISGSVGMVRNRSRQKDFKLYQKVSARAQIVKENVGAKLENLDTVLVAAIKTRNHFVHGSRLRFENISDYLQLMTDALEFVFAFSDLMDAGWDGAKWLDISSRHKFGIYIRKHQDEIHDFLLAWEQANLKA